MVELTALSSMKSRAIATFLNFYVLYDNVAKILANVKSRSRSLYVIARLSVCRLSSVTFVHPTQAIEIVGNISTPSGTLVMHDLCIKKITEIVPGKPLRRGS